MNERRKRNSRESAPSVAAAVRARIAQLEEELVHWREVLRDCEDPMRSPNPAEGNPPTGAKTR
jgi:hypothetical protein